MRIKLYLLILSITLIETQIFAQKESWNWYFGNHASLNFSTGAPVPGSASSMNTWEGVASISDSLGNLLFYTDGLTVYDSNHQQMQNGTGLFGSHTSTQSSIALQKPGSDSIYFIFTEDGQGGNHGLNYSVVNMSLNGGLGDVAIKNVPVHSLTWEKVTAIKHANGKDFWIVIIDWSTDDLLSYLFDSTGLSLNPVISPVDSLYMQSVNRVNGYMKASRQNDKISIALWASCSYDILDYDNQTGLASNHIKIQGNSSTMNFTYGVEFSSDGSKLYGTICSNPFMLFQFDLNAGSPADIYNFRDTISISTVTFGQYYFGALQIAPDKKIYCSLENRPFLGVINYPDSSGITCNYVDSGLYLNGQQGRLGLPNFLKDDVLPFATSASFLSEENSICPGSCVNFLNQSTNADSYLWSFPGATPSTSIEFNPDTICYNMPGIYDVTLIASNANSSDTLTLPNYIIVFPSPPPLSILQNVNLLSSDSGFVSYQWFWNGTLINGATDFSYEALQNGDYNVIATDINGCEVEAAIYDVHIGIDELSNVYSFQILPNPTTGKFSILSSSVRQTQLAIHNLLGEKIFSAVDYLPTTIDCQLFPPGIYFVSLQTENSTTVEKLIKQ